MKRKINKIPLDLVKSLFAIDTSSPSGLIRKRNKKSAGTHTHKGYYQVRLPNKNKNFFVYSHRIIWMLANDCEIPDGFSIDHIDGRKNIPENLRLSTPAENNCNKKFRPRSNGFPNRVYERKNGFIASMTFNYVNHKSPVFPKIEDAEKWLKENGPKIHGEFFKE